MALIMRSPVLRSSRLPAGRTHDTLVGKESPLATSLQLSGTYATPAGSERYHAQHVPLGFGIMFGAGTLSGLLGIGSGAVKVLAMDQAMRLPSKVSTTTSNFMIGVTAAASAGMGHGVAPCYFCIGLVRVIGVQKSRTLKGHFVSWEGGAYPFETVVVVNANLLETECPLLRRRTPSD